jgi:hypothetical protein
LLGTEASATECYAILLDWLAVAQEREGVVVFDDEE